MSIAEKLTQIAENEQKVYDAGKQVGIDDVMARITNYGARGHYTRAFYATDMTNMRFPDNVTIISCAYMFYDYRGKRLPSNIDLSNVTALESIYAQSSDTINLFSWATELVWLDDLKLPAPKSYEGTFSYMRNCIHIDMPIKVREDTLFKNTFIDTRRLAHVMFEGVIGQNGLDVSPCISLSHDSLMSIINCLKDYSTDTSGTEWKVTLGSTNLAKLTDEEKEIATAKGWVLA